MAYTYEDEFKAAGIVPQTVRLLDVVGFAMATAAMAALALAMAALAFVAIRSHAVVARWLAWPAAPIAFLLLVSFPLFGTPMFLFALWAIVTAGWRLLSRGESAPAHGTSGVRPAPA
jgi:hypothetical protein